MANPKATGRPPTDRSRRVINLSDSEMAWMRHLGRGERRIGEGISAMISGAAAQGVCPGCGEKFEDCDYLGGNTAVGDWIVLGNGFGCQVTALDLKWIYWAPGKKTQEGLLPWGDRTLGVKPARRTAIPQPDNVIGRLRSAGIVAVLNAEVERRGFKC